MQKRYVVGYTITGNTADFCCTVGKCKRRYLFTSTNHNDFVNWGVISPDNTVLCQIKSPCSSLLGSLRSPHAFLCRQDINFTFRQDLVPVHSYQTQFFDYSIAVFNWSAQWPDRNAHEESMDCCQEEDMRYQSKQCRKADD